MLETIASHLDSIAALAPTWGLLLVFVFMAVESSFVPFPSEVVMIPAGFLAARGELGLGGPVSAAVLATASGVLGSLAGAYVNYFLALLVGKPFLLKYGKWFFLKPAALERACEYFRLSHDPRDQAAHFHSSRDFEDAAFVVLAFHGPRRRGVDFRPRVGGLCARALC